MKFKLSGIDRLIIPKLLPEKGGMLEQTTIKEIVEIIGIKSSEYDDYGLVEKPDGNLIWDNDKIRVEKDFDLNKAQTTILKDSVEKKDKKGEINQWILDTCIMIKGMR